MRKLALPVLALALALSPTAAFAYVGPGAGLSLLGALWALVAAIGLAIAFVAAWPLRKMLRNRKRQGEAHAEIDARHPAGNAAAPQAAQARKRS